MKTLRHWRKGSKLLLLIVSLLAILAPAQPIVAQEPGPSAEAIARTFCTIAEWKSGRILSSLDIHDATQRAVLDKARSLSFPLTFQFLDIDAFRARISSLKKDVCAATDAGAAKTALEAMEAARKSIMDQFKTSREGTKPVMDNAISTFEARVKAQMKPYEDAVMARNKPEVDAEAKRIIDSDETARTLAGRVRALSGNKDSDAFRQAESALRTYLKPRLQPFLDQLKLRNETELKATAQQIAGPDGQALRSIGDLFKEEKAKLDAHKAESAAGWNSVWGQVVATRKGIILGDIDAAIAKIKADIEKKAQGLSEAERNERGITAFLSAIGKARGTLEASLGEALASGKQEAVEQAIGAFQTTAQEAAGRVNMPSSSGG